LELLALRRVLTELYPYGTIPAPFHLVEPALAVRIGQLGLREAAIKARSTPSRLSRLAMAASLIDELLGSDTDRRDARPERTRSILGQLMIGRLAEQVFEDKWLAALGDDDLRLRDDRGARTDTDFLVEDESGRQVFRLNIKFHGSRFQKAQEMVGLDPEDTFALATYKIHGALLKQEAEHLPYIFVVIGVSGLSGAQVGALVPKSIIDFVDLASSSPKVSGKRSIEERAVQAVLERPARHGVDLQVASIMSQLANAEWRVISARRANNLLRDLLFERAYALRVRGFAQNYRGAELDMHFSVSQDLHPLQELLDTLGTHGMPGLVSRLERGTL
jgi:hypothetical protein